MTEVNFDANQVDPNKAFDPLPAGWYKAVIVESERKATKAEDGFYLSLQLEIVDGQYKNRKVFTILNLWNKNPVAVEIANSDLSAICHATGVMQLKNTQQLHGRPMQIKLRVKPAEGNYDAGNDVRGYKVLEGGVGGGDNVPDFAKSTAPKTQVQPKAQPAAEAQPQTEAPAADDDDVPAWARE